MMLLAAFDDAPLCARKSATLMRYNTLPLTPRHAAAISRRRRRQARFRYFFAAAAADIRHGFRQR